MYKMTKSLEERSKLGNDLYHHEESSDLIIYLGAGLYYSLSLIKEGIEQGKHIFYHLLNMKHRRVESDPNSSFPYYERVFNGYK